jgi:hypothetical protein
MFIGYHCICLANLFHSKYIYANFIDILYILVECPCAATVFLLQCNIYNTYEYSLV